MARTFGGGSTDVVTFTNYADVNDLNTISIAGWDYRTGGGGANLGRMITKEDGASDLGFALINSNAAGVYTFEFYRWGTNDGKWSIGRPSLNTWSHHCVTYDYGSTSNDPNIYWDGSLQTETETSTPAGTLGTDAAAPIRIGNNAGGNRVWNGDLAEWAVWNAILTQEEATALSKGVCPLLIRPESLVFYAPVFGNQSPEPNLVHANSGTLTGTAASSRHPRTLRSAPRRVFAPYTAPAGGVDYSWWAWNKFGVPA